MAKSNRLKWVANNPAEMLVGVPVMALTRTEADETVAIVREYDFTKLSRPILDRMMTHAVCKLGDAMALPAGSTEAEKFAAMDAVWANLLAGDWTAKRTVLTAEEKAAKLRADVMAAWVSLEEGRTEKKFAKAIEGKAKATGVEEIVVITALSKAPQVAVRMAELAAKGTAGDAVDLSDLI